MPATIPSTGIMFVRKNGENLVLLTSIAKATKTEALRNLSTATGNALTRMLRDNEMNEEMARSLTGKHYRSFCGGSRLTREEYSRIQNALGAAVATKVGSSITFATSAYLEAQDAADQKSEISDQADQHVTDVQNELDAWKKAYDELLVNFQAGSANADEVAALVTKVNELTAQLAEAQRIANEADADAIEATAEAAAAEEQYEEIVPWYLRYKWHIGIGAAVIAVAGGAYWLTSRRPATKNTRLPAPTSPKHPAGF